MEKLYINKKMKMSVIVLLLAAFSVLCVPVVLAASLSYSAPASVVVDENGLAQINIKVSLSGIRAGVQFELMLDDGVSIEGVSFDTGKNMGVIPPTFARGSYYFSLISGTNEFQGDIICTVKISYKGAVPATVTVAGIQDHYIISKGNVSTDIDTTKSIIQVLPYQPPTAPPPTPATPATPLPSPPSGGDRTGDGVLGVRDATGGDDQDQIELDDEQDETTDFQEFDINISTDPDPAPDTDGIAGEDETTRDYTVIEDEKTPLAEFPEEKYLTWIWIIVITAASAITAVVFSELKNRRRLSAVGVAEGAAGGTTEDIEEASQDATASK